LAFNCVDTFDAADENVAPKQVPFVPWSWTVSSSAPKKNVPILYVS
jgi:hypothetical protein